MWSNVYCQPDSDQCGGLTVESIIHKSSFAVLTVADIIKNSFLEPDVISEHYSDSDESE